MNIRYNAPFSITFALLAVALYYADTYFFSGIITEYFVLRPGFPPKTLLTTLPFFLYVLGHTSWQHLLSSIVFVLLLGPILEEKYRTWRILTLVFATVVGTAIIHALFTNDVLLGSSSMVFMMVLLTTFTNARTRDIPLTFILVALLFITNEVQNNITVSTASQLAQGCGAVFGSLFGFFYRRV